MSMKTCNENPEKEAIRRHLLATILCSANTEGFRGSHSTWGHFWQGLFKKSRIR